MNVGDWVEAEVFGVAAYGIHLRSADGFEILVHTYDVSWTDQFSPREYCTVGDVLRVKIIRFSTDGTCALGWVPPPGRDPRSVDHERSGARRLDPGIKGDPDPAGDGRSGRA
ncbi:MAG: S1 RNA-binding domain-containing protein [Planctomycetes bacterium]|nr:S1 RNA-binding domain-containing protein [Planctomycetota bacterium]